MHRLNDTAQTPHCGWIYTVPETRTALEEDSYLELVDKVMENYAINAIEKDRETAEAEIQDYLCRRVPSGLCKGFINHFITSPKQMIEGLQSLRRITTSPDAFVDEETACNRAGVCRNCEFNSAVKGGVSHNGIPYMIKRIKGKKKTNLDDELHMCAICKCFLTLLVHVKAEILEPSIKKTDMYPEDCWKRREIEKLRRNQ